MKTKHLLYTLALAGTFAACTNEEFLTDASQDNLKADRPIVSNVALDVTRGSDANTRLAFDGSFTWEDGDKIAALLMDENNTGVRYGSATETDKWNKLSWLEKYHLVDYVHTNFAFAYNESTKKWNSTGNCNMLEGNYFLTYPYVSFDGKRQAYYNISQQKQIGNTGDARREAYAKGQIFVGYAQLEAKEGAAVLSAKMTEVLAPVRINIQSNCTEVTGEPLAVNKIVLSRKGFSSHYTIDPTRANYAGRKDENPDKKAWNLKNYTISGIESDQNTTVQGERHFNYANYLDATGMNSYKGVELYDHKLFGSTDENDYVYNVADNKVGDVKDMYDRNPDFDTRKSDTYYYDDAIRKVVRPLNKDNWSENTTQYVEVYTYNADGTSPMSLKSGIANTLGIISMVPAFDNRSTVDNGTPKIDDHLQLYIYTNKGVVGPVDLSVKNDGNSSNSVHTSDVIVAANPSMIMQTVTVTIDDDDIISVPRQMIINNTDDLKNYVQWLTNNKTGMGVVATLTNDVTIDDQLAKAIKGIKDENGFIFFDGSYGQKRNVKLATTEAQADILEYIDMKDDALVQVLEGATVNLTQAAHNLMYQVTQQGMLRIQVDKGGKLNITDSNKAGVGGWGDVSQYRDVTLKNYGEVNVKTNVVKNDGIVLANLEGTFNVETNAQIILATGSKNSIKGTINVAKGGELSASTEKNVRNYGIINNAGEIYNIQNLLAETSPERVLPGRINIKDESAITQLETNQGKVIYVKLPALAVKVEDNNYVQGIFEFTTSEAVGTKALTKAHVTDFTILDGATLSLDVEQTTLRHLTVKNAKVLGGTAPLVDACKFDVPATGTVATVTWNSNELNTINLIGNSNITTAKFTLNNADNSIAVLLANDGTKKDISLNGVVEFCDAANNYAILDLNSVTLTANPAAAVKVNKFVVDGTTHPQVSSTIKIMPTATVTADGTPKYDTNYIKVSGETIK